MTILSENSKGSRENYRPIAIAFDGKIEEHGAIAQQVLQLTKIIFESVKNSQPLLLELDLSFQEVVHPVSTEEAEVVEASDSEGKPDEHA